IKLDAYTQNSSGTTNEYVNVFSLDTNTRFSLGSIDSTYIATSICGNNLWVTRPILKIYNSGDTIKNAGYISSGFLGYKNRTGTCYNVSSSEWIDSTDHYIGVRYSGTSSVAYGWVRVNVTNYYTVLIKDFSLGAPLTGVEQFNVINLLNIYPNPASSSLQVAFTGNITNINVYDVLGKEVLNTKEKDIDISNLSNGVYNLSIISNEGVLNKRVVISH
ncbi:MAG: T9SS type A sorting domain-containing protein, partial [Bacteroidia bacterium]